MKQYLMGSFSIIGNMEFYLWNLCLVSRN